MNKIGGLTSYKFIYIHKAKCCIFYICSSDDVIRRWFENNSLFFKFLYFSLSCFNNALYLRDGSNWQGLNIALDNCSTLNEQSNYINQ